MGFAGNDGPQHVIPTVIALGSSSKLGSTLTSDAQEVLLGDAALAASQTHSICYPIRHGQVENWDWMEALWTASFFEKLRVNPEDHYVLLTEPPVNAPENREATAEIMFETFGVPGIYIGVQAVLALAASWGSSKATSDKPLTGIVVDSGDGVTHIIPVVEGYAIASTIKHVPVAGRDVTGFIQQLLRDRGNTGVGPEESLEVARRIKETECYVCPDLAKEFLKFEPKPFSWKSSLTGRSVRFEVGPERFLGPEVFFSPEMVSADFSIPLPTLIDSVVQACPIDARRDLYKNIVMSGGSTLFKDFGKRLQRDIRALVDERLSLTQESSKPAVNVVTHEKQRYAVWHGGSLLASMDQFPAYCHSKADYEEHGPGICRQSRVFGSIM